MVSQLRQLTVETFDDTASKHHYQNERITASSRADCRGVCRRSGRGYAVAVD